MLAAEAVAAMNKVSRLSITLFKFSLPILELVQYNPKKFNACGMFKGWGFEQSNRCPPEASKP
jgi:hypothetical protein